MLADLCRDYVGVFADEPQITAAGGVANVDEDALLTGVRVMSHLAVDYMLGQ